MNRKRLSLASIGVLVAVAGCSSALKEDSPRSAETGAREDRRGTSAPETPDEPRADSRSGRHEPHDESSPGKVRVVTAEPNYAKTTETRDAPPRTRDPERRVVVPESASIAPAPALPEHPLVAVAFVREGKLVRRPDVLRRLSHELGRDESAVVVALEPLGDAAPLQVGLDDLTAIAQKQGAHLLLVDVRPDDADAARTTFVVHATSRQVLAHVKPRESSPASFDVVAKLVRNARN